MGNNELISISQLSKISGISTRMLRYYDEKGILKPADYSEAGQRFYDNSALMTLQVISAFSYFGYSVDQIKDMIATDGEDNNLSGVLNEQRKMLEDEREKLNDIIDVLSGVIEKTERAEKVSITETAKLIKLTKNKVHMQPKRRLQIRKGAGLKVYTISQEDSFHNWLTWLFDNMKIPENANIAEFDAGQANVWRESTSKMKGMSVDSWYQKDVEPNKEGFEKSNLYINWMMYENLSEIPDGKYDVIFDSYVEYHDMPTSEWIHKVWTKLKPGGKFYSVCIDEEHKDKISKWCSILDPSYEEARVARLELYGIEKAKEFIGKETDEIRIIPKIDNVVILDKEELIKQIVELSGYTGRNENSRKQYVKLCRVISDEFKKKGKVEFESHHYLVEGTKNA